MSLDMKQSGGGLATVASNMNMKSANETYRGFTWLAKWSAVACFIIAMLVIFIIS